MFTIHNKSPWVGDFSKKKALTAYADCIYCQLLIISLCYVNKGFSKSLDICMIRRFFKVTLLEANNQELVWKLRV